MEFAWARCNPTKPPAAARPAPELAQPREGGWCWQLELCLLPSIRQGRFLLFLSPPWQWDCSWVFICHHCTGASPVPQCALLSHNQTPLPIFHCPWQRHPAQCHPVKDTLPFSLDKIPPSVFFLVPTARLVAPAVPHCPGLPAQLSQGPKSQAVFCWRSVRWEKGALTQQCSLLYWQCQGDLCYGIAHLQGEMLARGPEFLCCHLEAPVLS